MYENARGLSMSGQHRALFLCVDRDVCSMSRSQIGLSLYILFIFIHFVFRAACHGRRSVSFYTFCLLLYILFIFIHFVCRAACYGRRSVSADRPRAHEVRCGLDGFCLS
jgi:hypothetical protein